MSLSTKDSVAFRSRYEEVRSVGCVERAKVVEEDVVLWASVLFRKFGK